jgi:DNA-binding response OmpR family regulator
MITAYGDECTKRKVMERGAEVLLTKPIDFAAFRNESTAGSRGLNRRLMAFRADGRVAVG